jgi:hypothetical protein
VAGPANLFCDNQDEVKNMSVPEATLTKKHNAINYHVVRESAAMGRKRGYGDECVGLDDKDFEQAAAREIDLEQWVVFSPPAAAEVSRGF